MHERFESGFDHTTETGSTNADLLATARSGQTDLRPLLTDSQTAGRGRLGRVWQDGSRAASMLGSIPQRWDSTDPSLPLVPFAAGLAAHRAIRTPAVKLGWPNDLIALVGDRWRKVAGILVETTPSADDLVVVVGVGINIQPVETPDPIVAQRAVSLHELGVEPLPTNVELFGRLIKEVAAATQQLRTDPRSLMADYRALCATLGRTVAYQTSKGERSGLAEHVADSGELLIATAMGPVPVSVGDVTISSPDRA